MERIEYDLVVDRYAHLLEDFQIVGIDLTGAVLSMQIRVQREAPGTPIATIAQNNLLTPGIGSRVAGSNTVAGHLAAGNLDVAPQDLDPNEIIQLSVVSVWWAGAATVPYAAERHRDAVFYYDIKVSRASPPILPSILIGGKLIVRSGVTNS